MRFRCRARPRSRTSASDLPSNRIEAYTMSHIDVETVGIQAVELAAAGLADGRSGAITDRPSVEFRCRHCGSLLVHTFCDLGMSPMCESYVSRDRLNEMEPFYPLHPYVCGQCFLVQLQEYVAPDSIFTEYAYFSSYSESWLDHARGYTDQMIERFRLGAASQVVEVASHGGDLR